VGAGSDAVAQTGFASHKYQLDMPQDVYNRLVEEVSFGGLFFFLTTSGHVAMCCITTKWISQGHAEVMLLDRNMQNERNGFPTFQAVLVDRIRSFNERFDSQERLRRNIEFDIEFCQYYKPDIGYAPWINPTNIPLWTVGTEGNASLRPPEAPCAANVQNNQNVQLIKDRLPASIHNESSMSSDACVMNEHSYDRELSRSNTNSRSVEPESVSVSPTPAPAKEPKFKPKDTFVGLQRNEFAQYRCLMLKEIFAGKLTELIEPHRTLRIQIRNLQELDRCPSAFTFVKEHKGIDIEAVHLPDNSYFTGNKTLRGFLAFIKLKDDSSLEICKSVLSEWYSVTLLEEHNKKRAARAREREAQKNNAPASSKKKMKGNKTTAKKKKKNRQNLQTKKGNFNTAKKQSVEERETKFYGGVPTPNRKMIQGMRLPGSKNLPQRRENSTYSSGAEWLNKRQDTGKFKKKTPFTTNTREHSKYRDPHFQSQIGACYGLGHQEELSVGRC